MQAVKVVLDENIDIDAVLANDPNQLQLNDTIRRRIVEAVRIVHSSASAELITNALPFSGIIEISADNVGRMQLPNDFMRFVIFQLNSWKRPVIEAIFESSPTYYQQKSDFIGVRGGVNKPVCAIVTAENGRQALEMFSTGTSNNTVKIARYLPIPTIQTINEVEVIGVCELLYDAAVWTCAGLVATAYGDAKATGISETAGGLMSV